MRLAVLFGVLALFNARGTTIAETAMRVAGGRMATGYFLIKPSAPFTAASGVRVDGGEVRVDLVNGRFSVNLEPNDTGVPDSTRYLVTWVLVGAPERREVWNVSTSVSTLSINDVFSQYIAPTMTVSLGQLQRGGASTGQLIGWSGASWGPVSGLSNPMSAAGDLIIGGASGTAVRLAATANGYVLTLVGGVPAWAAASGGGGSVTSVFGRTGLVTAQSGDYTTTLVTEGTNLYFTNARVLSAMSGLYESPLTFSSPLSRSTNTVSCPTCLALSLSANKLLSNDGSGPDWRGIGTGLQLSTSLSIDTSVVPTKEAANSFTAANSFSGLVSILGVNSSAISPAPAAHCRSKRVYPVRLRSLAPPIKRRTSKRTLQRAGSSSSAIPRGTDGICWETDWAARNLVPMGL